MSDKEETFHAGVTWAVTTMLDRFIEGAFQFASSKDAAGFMRVLYKGILERVPDQIARQEKKSSSD